MGSRGEEGTEGGATEDVGEEGGGEEVSGVGLGTIRCEQTSEGNLGECGCSLVRTTDLDQCGFARALVKGSH